MASLGSLWLGNRRIIRRAGRFGFASNLRAGRARGSLDDCKTQIRLQIVRRRNAVCDVNLEAELNSKTPATFVRAFLNLILMQFYDFMVLANALQSLG